MNTNNIVEDIKDLTTQLREYLEVNDLEKFLETETQIQDKLIMMEFILANDPLMEKTKREEGRELFSTYKSFLKLSREMIIQINK